eukprot:9481584-Pyramimonas_sp.AAC.1
MGPLRRRPLRASPGRARVPEPGRPWSRHGRAGPRCARNRLEAETALDAKNLRCQGVFLWFSPVCCPGWFALWTAAPMSTTRAGVARALWAVAPASPPRAGAARGGPTAGQGKGPRTRGTKILIVKGCFVVLASSLPCLARSVDRRANLTAAGKRCARRAESWSGGGAPKP